MNFLLKIGSLAALLILAAPTVAQDTLVLQPDSYCGKDAMLRDLSPSTNYGTFQDIHAHAWTNSGTPVTHRSLFAFDLSAIPVGAIVIGSYLSLYSYSGITGGGHSTLSGPNEVVLQRITSSWDENTVTWGTQPTTTTTDQVILQVSTAPIQDYPNIDVSGLIQSMVNNPTTSYGFLFRLVNEQFYRRMVFASSDHPTSSLHPKLVIIYTSSVPPPVPTVDLGNDTSLCQGQNILLDATIPSATYLWSDGSTNATLDVSQSGTYWVEATTCALVSGDSITVLVNPLPNIVANASSTVVCEGQSLTLSGSGGLSYIWDNNVADGTPFIPVSDSTYTVTGTDTNGCENTAQIFVAVVPNPIADAGADATIILGTSITLNGSGGGTYSWSPATSLSCSDCSNPIASPLSTIVYFLTVIDTNGCSNQDYVTITVVEPELELFIPNVFSPNGDGHNDLFVVEGSGLNEFNIKVFDRWGQLIFESEDQNISWDGLHNGKQLNTAVFAYTLTFTDNLGDQQVMSGNVTLIK